MFKFKKLEEKDVKQSINDGPAGIWEWEKIMISPLTTRLNRVVEDNVKNMLQDIFDEIELIKNKQNDLSLAPYSCDELINAVINKLKSHPDFNTNKDISETCATLMRIIDAGNLFIIRKAKSEI